MDNMRMSDVVVLKMFKTMGLSEQTMQQIESDLRISQQHAKQEKKQGEMSAQTEIKKESAATK